MRPIHVRATFLALLVGLLGLALVPYPGSPAAASCIGPQLSIEGHETDDERVALVPGEEITVTGIGFVDGCDDTGSRSDGPGCSGGAAGDEDPAAPLESVELVALQGRPTPERTSLAVADAQAGDASEFGSITWTFVVPETLSPGPAVLTAHRSQPLKVRIVSLTVID